MSKKYFFLGLGLFVAVSLLFVVSPVLAGDYGLGDTVKASGLPQTGNIPQLIGNVIGTALSMISVIFFILMVYGGILWMTARGKEDQSKKALDTIIAAVIGILIVLGSYALTQFVFSSLSGQRDAAVSAPVTNNSGSGAPGNNDSGGNANAPAVPEPAAPQYRACLCSWSKPAFGIIGDIENFTACSESIYDPVCFVGTESDCIDVCRAQSGEFARVASLRDSGQVNCRTGATENGTFATRPAALASCGQ